MRKTKKIGICFSKALVGNEPLAHIGHKLPVYLRLLNFFQKKNWEVYILTRKTYQGEGIFKGGWFYNQGQFWLRKKPIKIDLVYDRTGGLQFPPEKNKEMEVVDCRSFKIFCWDKWRAYQSLRKFMPQTFWIEKKTALKSVLIKIKSSWVVLKPNAGLKSLGVFIGPKKEALVFNFLEKYPQYIAQEFIDTSGGIPGITDKTHDLRIVIINGEPVWSCVRIKRQEGFGMKIVPGGKQEVDYQAQVPETVKRVVKRISSEFFDKYDNPIFSLDFGIDKKGRPYLFEVNDQIGFPRWEMKVRDKFLNALIKNFEIKLKKEGR